jgi:Coenzyme PQQ synthesis protein D (PqqD)
MNDQNAPRSIRQNISIQQVGTETLVYDETRHKAFCLNETSSVIWRLADGERTVAQMSAAASHHLGAPVSEEIVLFALDEFRRDGLIEPSFGTKDMETVSRRDMLQRLAVGGVMLLPVIAVIVAPTAAQAYSGCFDCDASQTIQANQSARGKQLARARSQQLSNPNTLSPLPGSVPTFSPYTAPEIGQPIVIDPELQP